MSTNYPNSQDSFSIHQDNNNEKVAAAHINNLQDAVASIEDVLGSGSKQPTANMTPGTIPIRDPNGNMPVPNVLGVINQNLLFNGGFGLGSAGWSGIGSNGFHNVFGSGGEGSMLFNQTSTGSSVAAVTSTPIPVSAGTTLTLSADMSAAGVTAGSIYTQLIFYDSSGNSISGGSSIHATNGQSWTRYSAQVVSPANCDHALIFCAVAASTTITGSGAGWKRIKVEQGSIATTFSDDSTLNTVQYAQQLAGVFSGVDSWHSITPTGGWSAGPYNPRYRKDANGFVHLDGGIVNGTVGAVAFTLPAGYRPSQAQRIVCSSITQSSLGDESFLSFGADGTCTVKLAANTGAGVSLSGILFLAEN